MMNIAEKVFALSNCSKALIAKKMGVSRAYISQILSSRRNPTFKTLLEFCKYCGVSIEIKLKRTSSKEKAPCLPPFLKWLFWDLDFARMDRAEHKNYILMRILTRGDETAARWMMDTYSKRQIFNYIRRHRGQLDARSLNFWALYYGKEDKWILPLARLSAGSWQHLEKTNP
jgi:transcriptional regulator with XRE-family HTH domain